ncbi:retrovirus-related pol polyprotein from transposon TNT 1-94 [Tanacetum coccineum]
MSSSSLHRYTWVYFLKKKSHAPETMMYFIKRVENQNDIKVKQLRTDNGAEFKNSILVNFCDEKGISQNFSSPYTPEQNVFIHNHKDHLGKFDEKADDGYFLGYSLVSKSFEVFNTRRQQTTETFNITFDESTKAIKFSKPSADNITITESERYPPEEYLHHFEPSQRYQVDSNVVQFIEPHERPEPIVTKADASFDQSDQADQNDLNDQNDHLVQIDEILNDDQPKHSNHNND